MNSSKNDMYGIRPIKKETVAETFCRNHVSALFFLLFLRHVT